MANVFKIKINSADPDIDNKRGKIKGSRVNVADKEYYTSFLPFSLDFIYRLFFDEENPAPSKVVKEILGENTLSDWVENIYPYKCRTSNLYPCLRYGDDTTYCTLEGHMITISFSTSNPAAKGPVEFFRNDIKNNIEIKVIKRKIEKEKYHLLDRIIDSCKNIFKRVNKINFRTRVLKLIETALNGVSIGDEPIASTDPSDADISTISTYHIIPPEEVMKCYKKIHVFLENNPKKFDTDEEFETIFILLVLCALLLDKFDPNITKLKELLDTITKEATSVNTRTIKSTTLHGVTDEDLSSINISQDRRWLWEVTNHTLLSIDPIPDKLPSQLASKSNQLIFISAGPGAGKTTVAKVYAKNKFRAGYILQVDCISYDSILSSLNISGFNALSAPINPLFERIDCLFGARSDDSEQYIFIFDNYGADNQITNDIVKKLISYILTKYGSMSSVIVCTAYIEERILAQFPAEEFDCAIVQYNYFSDCDNNSKISAYREYLGIVATKSLKDTIIKEIIDYTNGNLSALNIIKTSLGRGQNWKAFSKDADNSLLSYFKYLISSDNITSHILCCAGLMANSSIKKEDIKNVIAFSYGPVSDDVFEKEFKEIKRLFFTENNDEEITLNKFYRDLIMSSLSNSQRKHFLCAIIRFLRNQNKTLLSYSRVEANKMRHMVSYIDHLKTIMDNTEQSTSIDLFYHAAHYHSFFRRNKEEYSSYYQTILSSRPKDPDNICCKLIFLVMHSFAAEYYGMTVENELSFDEVFWAAYYQAEDFPQPLSVMLKSALYHATAVILLHQGSASKTGYLDKTANEYLNEASDTISDGLKRSFYHQGNGPVSTQAHLFLNELQRLVRGTEHRFCSLTTKSNPPADIALYKPPSIISNQISASPEDYELIEAYINTNKTAISFEHYSSLDDLLDCLDSLKHVLNGYKDDKPIWYYSAFLDAAYVFLQLGNYILKHTELDEKKLIASRQKHMDNRLWDSIRIQNESLISMFPPIITSDIHRTLPRDVFMKSRNILCYIERKIQECGGGYENLRADLHQYRALLAIYSTKLYYDQPGTVELHAKEAIDSINIAIEHARKKSNRYREWLFLCYRGLLYSILHQNKSAVCDYVSGLDMGLGGEENMSYWAGKLKASLSQLTDEEKSGEMASIIPNALEIIKKYLKSSED